MMPLLLLLAAGIVTEMTPDSIREAIAHGAKEKKLQAYKLGGRSITANRPGAVARFTTPFLRVALAASEAKSTYQEMTEKDVTSEMVAPEVVIVASAFVPTGQRDPDGVRAVVVFPADGKPIQPDRIEEFTEEFSNAYGKKWEGHSIRAFFPLSILREDTEVRVVMESRKEHKAKFNLDKVR